MRWLVFFLTMIFAHDAGALSLAQALSHVYDHDPELRAARSNLRAVDESIALAKSGFRPSVTTSGTSEYRNVQQDSSQYDLATVRSALTIDQNIYRGGGTRAEVSRARSESAANREALRIAEQAIFLDAIEAYLAVWRDQRIRLASMANETGLEKQLQAAEDRFRFGEVTRTDVAQAEARLAAARSDRILAESRLDISRSRFVETVGLQPDQLDSPVLLKAVPPDLPAALSDVEQVPEVRNAELIFAASRHDIDVQFSGILPRLDVQAEAVHVEDPSRSIDRQSDFVASATLSIPLFQRGAESARVRRAKQFAIENRYRIDDAMRAAEQRITARWYDFQSARARLTSVSAQVRAAEIALEGVRAEALVGARTVLDILDQEEELFGAQVDYAQTQFEHILASYALASAMGDLTADRLMLDVDIYDPLINLRYTEDRWVGTDVRAVE